ncbi:zinc ribbon domain-containing protein [Bacillus songklensis]|uniref:Membrane-associated protein n=1 Tax=Bacillus songklensis TaxID=1069116 RepID=A0ABV8AZN1_9BACI
MESCENCGMPLRKGEQVCGHCGESQGQQYEGINKEKSVSFPYKKILQNVKWKPLSKKGKILLVTSLIFLAIIIGVHLTISSLISPMSVVEEFEKAVLEKDAKHLASIINKGQKTYSISEKEAASYISYLTKENNFTTIDNQLKMQANELDNSQEFVPLPITDKHGNQLVMLNKDYKKKWLFYDQYYLEFYPFSLTVSSNLPNTEVFVNDKKATKIKAAEEPVSIGFVFPGEYRFKGTFKSEYGDITKEENINLTEGNGNSFSVYLQLDGQYVSISSNYDDAILFVNGRSTGLKVNEIESFGPVRTDGSIKLHAERKVNDKTIKTDVIPVTDESGIDLAFEEEEEYEYVAASTDTKFDEVSQFMNDFYIAGVQAINSRNISVAEAYHDPSGPSLGEAKEYLKSIEKRGITEEFISMSLIDLQEAEGGYKVTTQDDYKIFYGNGAKKYKKFQTSYYLTKVDGKLKVHSLLKTEEIESKDL